MALRAWLSSRLNALIGTSSHTGRTATVERLLAGLVTSALAVILGRLRAEPGRQERGASVLCIRAKSQRLGGSSLPENGPRPCCKLPRIFWPNKWINLVTTCTDTKHQHHVVSAKKRDQTKTGGGGGR